MIKYLTICLITLFGAAIHAERVPGPEEFGKSTAKDAKAPLAAVKSHHEALAYAEAAIDARRDDLMVLCFHDPRVFHAFDEAVSKVSDAERQEELMLMMLRSSSSFWISSDFHWNRYPGKLDIDVPKIPLRRFIAHYLPGKLLDEHTISSYENRMRLAAEIHKVMQVGVTGGGPHSSGDRTGTPAPPNQNPASPVDSYGSESSASPDAMNRRSADDLQKQNSEPPLVSVIERPLKSSRPLWGGIILGTLTLIYLSFKRREPQGESGAKREKGRLDWFSGKPN